MRYSVPQFIDVKDKIVGPFTISQFIYLLGGIGSSYISYTIFPKPLSYITVMFFMGIASLFAFYKVNGRSFIEAAQGGFFYALSSKLYLWKYQAKRVSQELESTPKKTDDFLGQSDAPKSSHLKDLAWSLDVLDKS